GFRRGRWLQGTFVWSRFSAEDSANPVRKGNGEDSGPGAFNSITGTMNTVSPRGDFQDTSAGVFANCHTTMKHIAPLLAHYYATGLVRNSIQVHTPVAGSPFTRLTDWLSDEGRGFAWRVDRPVTGLASLGEAMSTDPAVARCQVARAWNWAMSKLDIVA